MEKSTGRLEGRFLRSFIKEEVVNPARLTVKRNKIVSTIGNAVGDAADTVATKARSVGQEKKNPVEEHPLAAAAIGIGAAAVAGVIGSRILSQRSKKKGAKKATKTTTKVTKPASKIAARAKPAKSSATRAAAKKS